MAWKVKHLLYNHEGWGLDPSTHVNTGQAFQPDCNTNVLPGGDMTKVARSESSALK